MDNERFLRRVEVADFPGLMIRICQDFRVGIYRSHSIPQLGYEDLNVVLETDRGKFFAKIFADSRSDEDCLRFAGLIKTVVNAGINHPRIYRSPQGYLDEIVQGSNKIRVTLLDYIDGKTLFELGIKPNLQDGIELVKQAAEINEIRYKPPFVYDSWAITNIIPEYKMKKDTLSPEDRNLVEPVVQEFKSVPIERLPHTLVHGDIRSTNVMKDVNGKLYIIDFSVANWYPRIQELAVLASDLFFHPENPDQSERDFVWLKKEYQRHIRLTPQELKVLPVFIRAAHAMHIIAASYEKARGNTEGENDNWLKLGRQGLKAKY